MTVTPHGSSPSPWSPWDVAAARTIVLPPGPRDRLVEHARRKVTGRHLPGEPPQLRAFGLLAGDWPEPGVLAVSAVYPLTHSARTDPAYADTVDEIYREHARPTATPQEQRGWVARPGDVLRAEEDADAHGWILFGNYHTHRIAWPEDPVRDSCTAFDTALARGSGMWVLIVSMVDPDVPRIRAFYEGDPVREAVLTG
ncbi:hypothetical protein [Streptomyces huiliensis]|uniref:hypothetical protein n=1 Tax=Streptomyces huiliensis TaxID=2876027 RepID=UPI001CBCCEF3|nr:hypothetical protein [Streptomyces huiliensis]MBZ4321102.1 hypothetical protein [Streptomyces huiliensis]